MLASITDRICTLNIEKRKLLQLKKYDTMFDRIDENTNNSGKKRSGTCFIQTEN